MLSLKQGKTERKTMRGRRALTEMQYFPVKTDFDPEWKKAGDRLHECGEKRWSTTLPIPVCVTYSTICSPFVSSNRLSALSLIIFFYNPAAFK